MTVIRKDLGTVTAYAYAVSKGYTGTEAEFAELMASYAEVAEEAAQSASAAAASASAAAASAASLTVDSAMSDSSANPVQNKVINGALTDVKSALASKALENGTDLDSVRDIGYYRLSINSTYINEPVSGGRRFLWNIGGAVSGSALNYQIIVQTNSGRIFTRSYQDGTFDDWRETGRYPAIMLNDGSDFNDLKDSNIYISTFSGAYTNCPIATGRRVLFVVPLGYYPSQVFQLLFDAVNARYFTRYYVDHEWTDWRENYSERYEKRTRIDLKDRLIYFKQSYINSEGVITASPSWDAYILPAEKMTSLSFLCYSNSQTYYSVGFYSTDIPSNDSFISGIHPTTTVSLNKLEFDIPVGAKSILFTNRSATSTEFEIYNIGAVATDINSDISKNSDILSGLSIALANRDDAPIIAINKKYYKTFNSNASQLSPNVYIATDVPVNGGSIIHCITAATSLYYSDFYLSILVRVHEYDADGIRIKYKEFESSQNSNEIFLDASTKTISVSIVPVIPPHENSIEDIFKAYVAVYTVNNVISETALMQKAICGMNPYTKALDHGGFWASTERNYENSPLSFYRAAREGIMFHNVDIVFSSDNVPFVFHDTSTDDIDGVHFVFANLTANEIKTHTVGDARYSWVPQTLAETAAYIKKLNGIIDMVDVSHAADTTKALAHATALPDYYRSNNIKPTWTNFDRISERNAFIENGQEFGVYVVCNAPFDTGVQSFLEYFALHPNTKFCVNINHDGTTDISNEISLLGQNGITVYTGVYHSLAKIPTWAADGYLSSTININYEQWKSTISSPQSVI